MKDTPHERLQPIRTLEDLARSLERGEVDPLSVSVHDVLEETMHEMERTQGMPDLDYVGDYLSAAGTVIRAKSEKLLPPDESEDDEAEDDNEAQGDIDSASDCDEEWSNEALLAHLMEYRVFQDAVEELARRDEAWRGVFPRSRPSEINIEEPIISTEVGLAHLLSALKDILEDAPEEEFSHVPQDELMLEEGMGSIRSVIQENGEATFRELFIKPVTRSKVIAVFLALLELIRLREVVVRQNQHFGEIIISFVPET